MFRAPQTIYGEETADRHLSIETERQIPKLATLICSVAQLSPPDSLDGGVSLQDPETEQKVCIIGQLVYCTEIDHISSTACFSSDLHEGSGSV